MAGTVATTTVTTYEYNDDGAPTSITTQVGSAADTIEYLTWDNFLPDADDPTMGTVSSANGNLTGLGSTPGATLTALSFDRRNRLVGFTVGGLSVSYDYHPDGMLASASVDDDGWLFYYDDSVPQRVLNICQSSSEMCSAWLGDLRHVSDGSEQALMKPRKDMAASYDPAQQILTPYRYDAYGADSNASTSATYDVGDNPLRYAAEMRDPVTGAYYLRARWYVPDLPSFVSRDPLAHLNRYGYGAGNPLTNVDPTGTRARSVFAALADLDDHLREGLDWLQSGIQGNFASLFLAPVLGSLEIVANPKSFWESVKTNYEGSDFYFALGIAGQIASGGLFPIGTEAGALIGHAEMVLSAAQTVTSSFHGGTLDTSDLLESSEEFAGGLAYDKLFEAAGRSRENVARHANESTRDPWSGAAQLLNETREAADRVRISTRHRARFDRVVKARAAARSVDDSLAGPSEVAGVVRRRFAEGLSEASMGQGRTDVRQLTTVLARGARQESSENDETGFRADRQPLLNECHESIGDVLRLLHGS